MPKIIENLKERLIDEARRQVEEDGYAAMTIRSVAKGCGVGVGTVYNYFPSKDTLVATFMLEDWQMCVRTINTTGGVGADKKDVVRCIYDELCRYKELNRKIFEDREAAGAFGASSSQYHRLLRDQLANPLKPFCSSGFTAEFIAEALLNWTMEGRDFEELYGVLQKLF